MVLNKKDRFKCRKSFFKVSRKSRATMLTPFAYFSNGKTGFPELAIPRTLATPFLDTPCIGSKQN